MVSSPEGAILQIGGVLCGLLQSTGCEEFGRVLMTLMEKPSYSDHALWTTEEMLMDFLNRPTQVSYFDFK